MQTQTLPSLQLLTRFEQHYENISPLLASGAELSNADLSRCRENILSMLTLAEQLAQQGKIYSATLAMTPEKSTQNALAAYDAALSALSENRQNKKNVGTAARQFLAGLQHRVRPQTLARRLLA